jgi:hypothetical protein
MRAPRTMSAVFSPIRKEVYGDVKGKGKQVARRPGIPHLLAYRLDGHADLLT